MPTQQERNAETRRRLLAAAREVFAQKGFAAANVGDIVRCAGRAHGSFYLHFANKEAALQALLEDAMARMTAGSRPLWQRDEPGASLRETVRRHIELFGADRDLWLLLDQRSSLEPAFTAMSDRWCRQLVDDVLHGVVTTGMSSLLPGLDAEVLAQVFAAMLADGTRALHQEGSSWTADELADEIARTWSLTLRCDDGRR